MNIKHPDIHGSLVLDYSVASFEYTSDTSSNGTYMFYIYSIDKDKDILSNEDREACLEIHTEDNPFYPIKIAADSGYVSHFQMTTLDGAAFLT